MIACTVICHLIGDELFSANGHHGIGYYLFPKALIVEKNNSTSTY